MRIAVIIDKREEKYVHNLKGLFGSNSVRVLTSPVQTVLALRLYCKQNKIDSVFTTQASLIKKLSGDAKATSTKYEGSMFKVTRDASMSASVLDLIEVVVLRELVSLYTINYQKFLVARYIKKITQPSAWLSPNKFNYHIVDQSNKDKLLRLFSTALYVAVDIETSKDLAIKCCGYTTAHIEGDEIKLDNFVLPIDSLGAVATMRELNAHPVRKALQNGKYDSAYFYLYSAPLSNYLLDTINMHHSWYSELPKDLATLAAFYVRDFRHWKGSLEDKNLQELYEYNAKDTFITALVVLAWLKEAPVWAKNNYLQEFPVVHCMHLCEMTGLKIDVNKLDQIKEFKAAQIKELNTKLDKQLNVTNFNTNSPKQMKALLKVLGYKDAKSADEKTLVALKGKHPLNSLLIDEIIEIRKLRKLVSTYLKRDIYPPTSSNINKEIVLYALNPHGTETGRLASKDSHFWCGMNIQNIPRGNREKETYIVKDMFVSYEGYYMAEADYAQAESRGTGYIVGQQNLIDILETKGIDFHRYNASSFFGVAYENVSKSLRTLAKPVNHGANYNMGAYVLIQQMGGELEVLKAGKLLGLPSNYTAEKIAVHLLKSFDKTYPKIRHNYHNYVKMKVLTTKKLVGATGWTRYCFGDPNKNKLDLNSYVAHNPQSLNAMILNKAFLKVFYNIWWNNPQDLILNAQIHDSILFQYKKGRDDLADDLAKEMVMPIQVTDIDGVTREMVVPVDVNKGLVSWGDKAG